MSPKGDMMSHTEDPQTLGASVQNLVAMATWLLGLEHLPIRKPPRPSKFFPVHHSPTSRPTSQYETLIKHYNKTIHIKTGDPSPGGQTTNPSGNWAQRSRILPEDSRSANHEISCVLWNQENSRHSSPRPPSPSVSIQPTATQLLPYDPF